MKTSDTGPASHDSPAVHDEHPLADRGDDGQVVGDEEQRRVAGLDPSDDEVEDAGLDGDVERRRRLVAHEQPRVVGEGDREDHALPLSARELVRVGPGGLGRAGQPHLVEQRGDALADRAPPGLGPTAAARVREDRLRDLGAHAHRRVEGGHRLLEDHRHVVAPHLCQIAVARADDVVLDAGEARRARHARPRAAGQESPGS